MSFWQSVSTADKRNGLLILAALFGLTLLLLEPVHALFPGQHLTEKNHAYLNQREHDIRDELIKLGALEGVYKMLQSSKVGFTIIVDTEVTIGEALAPVVRVIENISELLALNGVCVIVMQFANTHAPTLAWYASVLVLVLLAIKGGLTLFGNHSRINPPLHSLNGAITAGFYLFLFCHIVVPYGIHSAQWLSQTTIAHMESEIEQNVTHIHSGFTDHQHGHSLLSEAKQIIGDIEAMRHEIHNKVDIFIKYRVVKTLAYLIEMLVPLAYLALFYFAVRLQFHRWLTRGYHAPAPNQQERALS